MIDDILNHPLWFAAGSLVCTVMFFHPWVLLVAGAVCGWKWWTKWRFKNMNLAEKKTILDTREWSYVSKKKLMYLGTTEDGTIRWWFGDGDWVMPQAIDNGKFYWDKRVKVRNSVLLKHLKGFYEMGNEWPEYYKIVSQKEPTKKKPIKKIYKKDKDKNRTWTYAAMIKYPTSFDPKIIEAVESELPRADYADVRPVEKHAATATISAIDHCDTPLIDLAKTVEDLEKEVHGRCPTLVLDNDWK